MRLIYIPQLQETSEYGHLITSTSTETCIQISRKCFLQAIASAYSSSPTSEHYVCHTHVSMAQPRKPPGHHLEAVIDTSSSVIAGACSIQSHAVGSKEEGSFMVVTRCGQSDRQALWRSRGYMCGTVGPLTSSLPHTSPPSSPANIRQLQCFP